MDGAQHIKDTQPLGDERLLFITKTPGIHGTHLTTLGWTKGSVNLKKPSGFEPRSPGLGIQHPNHWTKGFGEICSQVKALGSSQYSFCWLEKRRFFHFQKIYILFKKYGLLAMQYERVSWSELIWWVIFLCMVLAIIHRIYDILWYHIFLQLVTPRWNQSSDFC